MSLYLLSSLFWVLPAAAQIVMQGPGERNYHIFGMMFAGMEKSARDLYRLTSYEDYRYLPEEQGDMGALAADWKELNEAYAACNFSPEEVDWQNSALAAVLLMGQLDFQDGEQGDAAVISNNEIFDSICHVLMLDGDCLKAALMTSVFTMRGETITKHLNVLKCINARNATAKALYDRLFRWLVFKINLTLVPDASDVNSLSSLNIGILDIFGFENFKTNGFDQMCINLANEKLHFFFNQHIFQAEMGSYAAEGIDMSSDVMFHDNKAVIEMFFRKPAGLLGLLDEESGFDRATASSLLDKFNKNLVEEPLYKVVKGNYAFEVVHFAATIKYHTDGFLEKNTDPLPSLMAETCRTSDNTVVRTMFTDKFDVVLADAPKLGRKKSMFGGFGTKKGNKQSFKKSVHDIKKASIRRQKHAKKELQTVSNSFRASLDMLMLKMGFCEPHFVRCIKPNPQKQPQQWENDLVMRQMQYTGMMQTVQMRREGFPFRIPFVEFFNSYHGIVFDFLTPMKGSAQNVKELLERLEAKVELEREERGLKTLTSKLTGYRVAKTMVFLKYWHPDILEAMSFPFGVSAITIQRVYRGHMARKRFKPLKQRYRDDCAAAVTFIDDMTQRSARTHNTLETLLDEERAKGPIGLGIQKPPDVKAEKKQAKHAGEVEVNQKKFEKDLNKIKKKVVKWWVKYERAKQCHLDQDGSVYPWFHGLISRVEAEDYLFDQDSGAFLIRVSERVNGYALSFRYKQRIRHYKLGFSSGGGYEVLGCTEDFATLIELIEYFQLSPITPGEDDLLGEPVPFAHDLGLGITQDETVLGKRPPKLTQDERAEKAKSMSLMNILDDESAGSPMADETFLEDAEAKPHWLRGKISRGAAEDELRERGMTDGRFVVREKLRSAERIVLALSVTFRRKFYHHLLARQLQGEWLLDEKPLDYSDSLDEVIAHLQKKKSPRLAGLLEKDPYASPEDLTDAPPEAAATAAVAKPSMVPAPAYTQVLGECMHIAAAPPCHGRTAWLSIFRAVLCYANEHGRADKLSDAKCTATPLLCCALRRATLSPVRVLEH